jgi:spore maturation protein SpmA
MNLIFPIVLTFSILFSLFIDPSIMLTAFQSATEKAVELSISLIAVYAVWQGLSYLLEVSGISKKISKLFYKPVSKLFKTSSEETVYQISLNFTANALGLSGVATPAGIESMRLLDSEENEQGKTLLTVIACTSIQILPITVIQLLAKYGQSPNLTIILTLISTTFSTALGIILAKVFK